MLKCNELLQNIKNIKIHAILNYMNQSHKKFIFTVEKIEEIFLEISDLWQFNNEKLNFLKVECSNKNFLSPIEDVFVNTSFNLAENNLSLLGIIKQNPIKKPELSLEIIDRVKKDLNVKSEENYFLIMDENNTPEFTVRKINDFGIYVFAGRPDLCHYKYNSSGISIDSLKNFKNKLEKFAKLMELLVNEAYSVNNIEFNDNIEYKFVPNKVIEEERKIISHKREVPEALRRFYARNNE